MYGVSDTFGKTEIYVAAQNFLSGLDWMLPANYHNLITAQLIGWVLASSNRR